MTYTLGSLSATEEQAAIIDYARGQARQNLMINALAGAAKTSTLRFLCQYLPPEPTLSVAFNKRIADEMSKVLPDHVRCATMNSIGHRVWGAAIYKRLTLETKKNYNIVKSLVDKMKPDDRSNAYEIFGDLVKAIGRAKVNGYVPVDCKMGRSLISESDFFDTLEEVPDDWFKHLVNTALREGISQAYQGLVDFDDQIYMSTLFGGSFPQHARVQVDETQDLNPLQHIMIERLVGPDTHLTAVGDPWQSIYAFRGADTKAMPRMAEHFNMHQMPLSVSFRCPIEVIKNAHWRVPHMKWPEWAVPGRVETLNEWSSSDIPDNSAIICRNNAPLMSCALALLRAGRGVHLVGSDLGPQLIRTLKKISDNLSLNQQGVLDAIDEWETSKMRKSRAPESVADKAECLRVFAGYGPTLGSAIAYCERIFALKGPVQLLSGHKAKGLEWDTCFHLDSHRIPSPWAKEGEALEQELNVRYVIETRPRKELLFVRLDQFNGGLDD